METPLTKRPQAVKIMTNRTIKPTRLMRVTMRDSSSGNKLVNSSNDCQFDMDPVRTNMDQNPSQVDNHTCLSNQHLHNSGTKGTIESGNQYQKPQIGRKRKQGSDQKRKMWTAEQRHQ